MVEWDMVEWDMVQACTECDRKHITSLLTSCTIRDRGMDGEKSLIWWTGWPCHYMVDRVALSLYGGQGGPAMMAQTIDSGWATTMT